MYKCIIIGIGGGLGAILRYLLSTIPIKCVFPFTTLSINFIGAIIIGCVAGYSEKHISMDPLLLLFLKTGLCGGFTTFSTFSLESFQLMQQHRYMIAVLYIFGSIVLCLIGIGMGKYIAGKL